MESITFEEQNKLLKKEIENLKEIIKIKDIEINKLKNDRKIIQQINYGYIIPKN